MKLFEYVHWVWEFSQPERYAEIKGIVRSVNDTRLSLSTAVLVNALYELESYCTSIIAL